MNDGVTILWRRLDLPGHEAARLVGDREQWHLAGTAVFAYDGEPCRLDYAVWCDAAWRTQRATVTGHVGLRRVSLDLARDDADRWSLDGEPAPALVGCVDVDLGFSPSTNLLPIRRLDLAVGASAPVRAAWVRLPGPTLAVLNQVYQRTAVDAYHYESGGGAFTADLTVDDTGLVTRYPNLWQAEASAGRLESTA